MRGSATGDPRDPHVAAAFAAVPRARFLPPDQQRFADVDRALPIGYDVTNSQPSTVRAMLELLAVRPGDRVLDVGCGSGWTTALLAHLTGPEGHVTGVELIPEVLASCRRTLGVVPDEKHRNPSASGAFRQGLPQIELHQARPGELGWPDGAPYDRILVSADAAHVPVPLVEQLTPDGTLVGPVRGRMLRIHRRPGSTPQVEEHGRYVFVPLVS
ncbi:protein-L-isoaspartate carboxylmethyltransferase [Nocardioides aromaticivorans]|uniref:Protein-L-isoaspartate O-methyltransferase n=1 Tax=Nocardioides aromaticivorans TaxID=200618 RepID=A0ABX7PG18_9ACTN|nr:protein-L-isoaspartate O-methyltransferase [Nocardioides aromaticivorans]QSR24793.1 protein-L-isoaspartate carboxylmethyltransferase [Nocardioides aromaticivorans]